MFDWPNRPTKVEAQHRITGDNPRRVFQIGKYRVEVPDDPEADATYHVPSYGRGEPTEPRAHFPNMEVRDGEMRIPLEDFAAAVLSRVEPTEIAVALWQDADVRAEFMDALTRRWNERGIDDGDRRKFLAGIKEAIHSKALDEFAYTAQKLERAFGAKWFFYHEVNSVNQRLHEAGYEDREGNPIRLRHEDSDPVFKISGANWNEAREHWRQEAEKMIAAPAEVEEAFRVAEGRVGQ